MEERSVAEEQEWSCPMAKAEEDTEAPLRDLEAGHSIQMIDVTSVATEATMPEIAIDISEVDDTGMH